MLIRRHYLARERKPVQCCFTAQTKQRCLMWEETERDVRERLRKRSVCMDDNSCAGTTIIGSAEGLALCHIHRLSHEAAFNRMLCLVWEKGPFFFICLLGSTERLHILFTWSCDDGSLSELSIILLNSLLICVCYIWPLRPEKAYNGFNKFKKRSSN